MRIHRHSFVVNWFETAFSRLKSLWSSGFLRQPPSEVGSMTSPLLKATYSSVRSAA